MLYDDEKSREEEAVLKKLAEIYKPLLAEEVEQITINIKALSEAIEELATLPIEVRTPELEAIIKQLEEELLAAKKHLEERKLVSDHLRHLKRLHILDIMEKEAEKGDKEAGEIYHRVKKLLHEHLRKKVEENKN